MTDNQTDLTQLLEQLDLHDIERLKTAKEAINLLEGRKASLLSEIKSIEVKIQEIKTGRLDPSRLLSASMSEKKRKSFGKRSTGQRKGSLASYIVEVLSAKKTPMHVSEIQKAVLAKGYRSKSKKFEKSLRATLSQMTQTERAGRGMYRLKP